MLSAEYTWSCLPHRSLCCLCGFHKHVACMANLGSRLTAALHGAGESKVHDCLRANLDKLSDACRKEEISLSVLQASNTELMPNIANACKVSVILMSAHSNPEALRGAFMECCQAYQWEGCGCYVTSLSSLIM